MIQNDGQVKCWGSSSKLSSVPSSIGIAKKISVAGEYACAISESSNLFCWGRLPSLLPFPPQEHWGTVVDVSTSEKLICALSAEGEIKCWGLASDTFWTNNELEKAITKPLKKSDYYTFKARSASEFSTLENARFQKIVLSSDSRHICGQTQDGFIHCWGNHEYSTDFSVSEFVSIREFVYVISGSPNSGEGGQLRVFRFRGGVEILPLWFLERSPSFRFDWSKTTSMLWVGANNFCAVDFRGRGYCSADLPLTASSLPIEVSRLKENTGNLLRIYSLDCGIAKSGYPTCWGSRKKVPQGIKQIHGYPKKIMAQPSQTLRGTPAVGKNLSVAPTKWDSEVTLKYQWYLNNSKIRGANKSTLQLLKSHRKQNIFCEVTASKVGHETVTKRTNKLKVK
jgi:hypothetical protein